MQVLHNRQVHLGNHFFIFSLTPLNVLKFVISAGIIFQTIDPKYLSESCP